MFLYVDETGNDDMFIVAGFLVTSEEAVSLAYKRFRKRARNFNIREKYKSKLFTEFKSNLLDNTYVKIKEKMLEEVLELNGTVFFSCYSKYGDFNQEVKEAVYIDLLQKIVSEIHEECEVVFDGFGKKDFEDTIVSVIGSKDNISSIVAQNSERVPGLQFVDNICSVIRLHRAKDEKDLYYEMIEDMLKEV